jgi:ankyrin repeat protein
MSVLRGLLMLSLGVLSYGCVKELITAAEKGDIATIKALVTLKCDVNSSDDYGNTALIWAAYKGDTKIVELLIQAKADVRQINRVGNEPLYYAVKNYQRGAAELLLVCGKTTVERLNQISQPYPPISGEFALSLKKILVSRRSFELLVDYVNPLPQSASSIVNDIFPDVLSEMV